MVSDVLPWLTQPLIDALRTQRGHALLVQGPTGSGQFDFSFALARAWLCETALGERANGLACGQCESCHLVTSDQIHPDLCVLLPEALHLTLGWRQKTDAPESSDNKKKPSEWISIDQVRAAIEFSTLTRGRGRLKVVLVHPAERMQQAAASALLKLLEEPSGNQRFVLSCGDASALMPTVRSRCHAVDLPLPAPALATRWLADQGLADAALLLAASGGQPLAVLERHRLGLDAALWKRLPGLVAAGDASAVAQWSLPLVLDALQKICHDALLATSGAAPRYFPPGSIPARADVGRLSEWGRDLRRLTRHAQHPWSATVMLESLFVQGSCALAADSLAPRDTKALSVHSIR